MKKILLFTLLIILIPLLIIGVKNSDEIINKIKYGIYSNKTIKVKNNNNGEYETLDSIIPKSIIEGND